MRDGMSHGRGVGWVNSQAGAEGMCGRVLVVFGLRTNPITEHCRCHAAHMVVRKDPLHSGFKALEGAMRHCRPAYTLDGFWAETPGRSRHNLLPLLGVFWSFVETPVYLCG